MGRVRVKICGVRRLEEAEAALDAGADALGFNFWPKSPRFIAAEAAREIIKKLPPLFASVGVFVNEEARQVVQIASTLNLTAVQLHGDETPDYCRALEGMNVVKALRVREGFDPESIRRYGAGAVLLDAGLAGSYGGTGRVFDWRVAIEAKRFARIILAGGLTADNVEEAILQVRPMAVDVCSGVESEPGRKDIAKLRQFMAAVSLANARLTGAEAGPMTAA